MDRFSSTTWFPTRGVEAPALHIQAGAESSAPSNGARPRGAEAKLSSYLLVIMTFSVGSIAFGADKAIADKDTIQLVEFFIKSPTADLPPSAIPAFMKVDPETLPTKLRAPCEAKQMELRALLKIAEGKRKPPIRRYDMAEPKCGKPTKGTPQLLHAWTLAGFKEATEDEVAMASSETKCSECELETEFSLQRMSWEETQKGESKKTKIRYFFYDTDPVWLFISMYEKNLKLTTGTAFFGVGGPPKCH